LATPLPLRTLSIILNAAFFSTPRCNRYTMISSRVGMTSLSVATLSRIRLEALFIHTSVPCESPDMRTSSENVRGCVSTSICRTNAVPNSGSPRVPVLQRISCSVTPSASGDVNSESVCGSLRLTSRGSMPVVSCSIRMIVGTS
jgi:hypothetical protein